MGGRFLIASSLALFGACTASGRPISDAGPDEPRTIPDAGVRPDLGPCTGGETWCVGEDLYRCVLVSGNGMPNPDPELDEYEPRLVSRCDQVDFGGPRSCQYLCDAYFGCGLIEPVPDCEYAVEGALTLSAMDDDCYPNECKAGRARFGGGGGGILFELGTGDTCPRAQVFVDFAKLNALWAGQTGTLTASEASWAAFTLCNQVQCRVDRAEIRMTELEAPEAKASSTLDIVGELVCGGEDQGSIEVSGRFTWTE